MLNALYGVYDVEPLGYTWDARAAGSFFFLLPFQGKVHWDMVLLHCSFVYCFINIAAVHAAFYFLSAWSVLLSCVVVCPHPSPTIISALDVSP
jgi:hypothetical protein